MRGVSLSAPARRGLGVVMAALAVLGCEPRGAAAPSPAAPSPVQGAQPAAPPTAAPPSAAPPPAAPPPATSPDCKSVACPGHARCWTCDEHGRVIEHREEVMPGTSPVTRRYFPDAGDGVMQDVPIESALIHRDDVACARDQDCVVVDGECCGCSSGGSRSVVARSHAAIIRARRAQACRGPVRCVAVESTSPTCEPAPVPACVEHVCTLRLR